MRFFSLCAACATVPPTPSYVDADELSDADKAQDAMHRRIVSDMDECARALMDATAGETARVTAAMDPLASYMRKLARYAAIVCVNASVMSHEVIEMAASLLTDARHTATNATAVRVLLHDVREYAGTLGVPVCMCSVGLCVNCPGGAMHCDECLEHAMLHARVQSMAGDGWPHAELCALATLDRLPRNVHMCSIVADAIAHAAAAAPTNGADARTAIVAAHSLSLRAETDAKARELVSVLGPVISDLLRDFFTAYDEENDALGTDASTSPPPAKRQRRE